MKKLIHIPYTYLIGWPSHNLWYYGVRYAKGCHPGDLWAKYKTSSKYVKKTTEKLGDPTVKQVRKIFTTVNSARVWEEKVLRRMRVVPNPKWLNKNDVKSIDPLCATRGDSHWTHLPKHKDKVLSMLPILKPWLIDKVSGNNHYSRQPDYDNSTHNSKSPEFRNKLRAKVAGDKHYTRQPDYDNSNHYAKRPESRLLRAELNKTLFTGYIHKLKVCPKCQKEIPANNFPQHVRKFHPEIST